MGSFLFPTRPARGSSPTRDSCLACSGKRAPPPRPPSAPLHPGAGTAGSAGGRRPGDPSRGSGAGSAARADPRRGAARPGHPPPGRIEPGETGGGFGKRFPCSADLSQKGELVQTERIIRLAKAANISLGSKFLPDRELQSRSIAGPSGFAESPGPPSSSSFPQKRDQGG